MSSGFRGEIFFTLFFFFTYLSFTRKNCDESRVMYSRGSRVQNFQRVLLCLFGFLAFALDLPLKYNYVRNYCYPMFFPREHSATVALDISLRCTPPTSFLIANFTYIRVTHERYKLLVVATDSHIYVHKTRDEIFSLADSSTRCPFSFHFSLLCHFFHFKCHVFSIEIV